jgi:hypothetical protein
VSATRQFDYRIEGLNEVLRALRTLPKEGQNELRKASNDIATRHMAPAWRNAALFAGDPWGPVIADSVKVKRDRIPAVSIGGNRPMLSGGATATMLRAPSDSGRRRGSFAPFERTQWIGLVRGTYQYGALREWTAAVDRVIAKWGRM